MTNIFRVVPSVLHQLSENVKKFQWRRNKNPTSTLPAGWIGLGWTKQGIRMQFTNFFKRNSNGTCLPIFLSNFARFFSYFSIWQQTSLKPTKNQYLLNSLTKFCIIWCILPNYVCVLLQHRLYIWNIPYQVISPSFCFFLHLLVVGGCADREEPLWCRLLLLPTQDLFLFYIIPNIGI